MSYHLSSRDHEITLADAIAALPTAGLPARRQQEIASALRTIARALNRPPDRIPAQPRHLSLRLKEIAPHAIGISTRRWNNIRSLARTGLALVLPMSPGRNTNALSPSWDALSRQLQSRSVRTALSRLMHFCYGPVGGRRSNLCRISHPSRQHSGERPGCGVPRNGPGMAIGSACGHRLAAGGGHGPRSPETLDVAMVDVPSVSETRLRRVARPALWT